MRAEKPRPPVLSLTGLRRWAEIKPVHFPDARSLNVCDHTGQNATQPQEADPCSNRTCPSFRRTGLTKTFKGVNALQSLDLSVHKNSIFGFLGPNGAGKTTTIKLLLGLSRPRRQRHHLRAGHRARQRCEIRRRVGYLAQDPRYYEHMTARETLRFTARFFYTGPKAAIEDRIQTTLDLVGLKDKADRPIKGFSGGERQRLGIAQAQVNYPDLLILDEPAASLDPQGRRDVLEVMERLRKYTTIFYSTHILDDVQRVSDTVAILNKGRLIAQAPIEQLLAGGGGSTIYVVTLKGDADAGAAARRRATVGLQHSK